MLSHLLKIIWNKKGSHSLMIVEIWASFMVLFGLLSLVAFNAKNYLEPIGFNYENVWSIDLTTNQDTTALPEKLDRVMQRIRSYPEVESVSRSSPNYPFSSSMRNNAIEYNKTITVADYYSTDPQYATTLDMPVLTGRWFAAEDRVSKYPPVVINEKLREAFFTHENPLGKVIKDGEGSYKIVGTVGRFKSKGEFMADKPAVFFMADRGHNDKLVLVKTKPDTDARFEAEMIKELAAMVPGWGMEVTYLSESRKNRQNLTLVPVIIFLIISGFLLINVALGLFGILNLSIARRRSEIGLRRAMGATEGSVTFQFLGEMWVLAAFSVILGLLFALQFPIMNVFDIASGVYLTAIAAAIVVIFIIVTLCAWYPSRQAARVQPAVALHEE